MKKTPRAGYAIVSSRSENKVAFVDLQPLLQYYRTMYFTTQANYDQTKTEGSADNQWPFTFTHAPGQKPVVTATLNVTKPTSVRAGWFARNYTELNTYSTAFVATMDGQLLMYNVGELITQGSGGSIGAPFKTVAVGMNPTSIQQWRDNQMFVTCRGDNKIFRLSSDGTILSTLRDSRIVDAVFAVPSSNGRCACNACYGVNMLHVMDFKGKKVITYRIGDAASLPPVDEPLNFEYSKEEPVEGCPFMFTLAEII